jgi:hypothetical protein
VWGQVGVTSGAHRKERKDVPWELHFLRRVCFPGSFAVSYPLEEGFLNHVGGRENSKVPADSGTDHESRRIHPSTAQPLNLKFESLNATTSKKEYNIRDISSILYNL